MFRKRGQICSNRLIGDEQATEELDQWISMSNKKVLWVLEEFLTKTFEDSVNESVKSVDFDYYSFSQRLGCRYCTGVRSS
jgi:hypothetical protein